MGNRGGPGGNRGGGRGGGFHSQHHHQNPAGPSPGSYPGNASKKDGADLENAADEAPATSLATENGAQDSEEKEEGVENGVLSQDSAVTVPSKQVAAPSLDEGVPLGEVIAENGDTANAGTAEDPTAASSVPVPAAE